MPELFVKYRDDFLNGSYTLYNYARINYRKYLYYVQMMGFQKIGPNYYNEVEFGQEYMINYCVEGEGTFIYKGEEFTIKKGDLIFVKNFAHHIIKPIPDKPYTFAFLHLFDNESLAEIYKRCFSKNGFLVHNVDQGLILPNIVNIGELLSSSKNNKDSAISIEVYQLLLNICSLAEQSKSDPIDLRISPVLYYINQNFTKNIKFNDILDHSEFSKNHLERLFKAEIGMTIQDYIFQKRLRLAQELLVTTNLNVSEISDKVGLSEYRSLYHMFKKALHLSPLEFRRKNKENL